MLLTARQGNLTLTGNVPSKKIRANPVIKRSEGQKIYTEFRQLSMTNSTRRHRFDFAWSRLE